MTDTKHRFFQTGGMPSLYVTGNAVVTFKTDFREWLEYERVCHLGLAPDEAAQARAAIVIDSAPENIAFADLDLAMTWFYSRGDIERITLLDIPKNIIEARARKKPSLDLFWDYNQLFDSFLNQYGINLYTCGTMHWWEFLARLEGLRHNSALSNLRSLRETEEKDFKDDSGKKSKQGQIMWKRVMLDKIFSAIPCQQQPSHSSDYDEENWNNG